MQLCVRCDICDMIYRRWRHRPARMGRYDSVRPGTWDAVACGFRLLRRN